MLCSNRWGWFAPLIAGFWITSAAAQQVNLTLDQANTIARQAFIAKDYATANTLAYGVLQTRPDDPAALVIAGATDPFLGQPKRGRLAARRAFRLTKDPRLRFEAAYFAASASAKEERFNASKYWLRRAHQIAPDAASKARVAQLFQAVRQRSPLTVQLDFNVSPSSNINNGSREETTDLLLFGGGEALLSVDAQALSGLQYRTTAAFQYRLHESRTKRTTLNFGADLRYYTLSSRSRKDLAAEDAARVALGQSPRNISGSTFNFETLYAGIRQQRISSDQKTSLSYGFTIGQSWYGGSPLSRFAGGNISRTHVLSPTRSFQYGLNAQRQFRLDNRQNSSNVVTVNGQINQRIQNRGLLSFGAYLRDTNSDASGIDNTALGLTMTYRLEKPVFSKTRLELSLGLQRAEYETSVAFGERNDNRASASATLIFSDFSYFGFNPTTTFTAARTNSTVGRFRTDSYGINIGLRSAF